MTKKMTRSEKIDVVYAALEQLPDTMTNADIFSTVMMLLLSYNIRPEGVKTMAQLMIKLSDTEDYVSKLDAMSEGRVP